VTRAFIRPQDLAFVLREYRPAARLVRIDRLTGASKKGVYRLGLDDGSTVILYAWSAAENYWPAADDPADDPFSDATGPDLLAAASSALAAAGIRTPQIYGWDTSRTVVAADLALVEDVRGGSLEDLLSADPAAAARPLSLLGDALRAMAGRHAARYGKAAFVASAHSEQASRPEDVVLTRALRHLGLASERSGPLADVRDDVAELLTGRHRVIIPRAQYALVHGELGPDHVLLTQEREPVIIDIEGLTYFDVEWEHAFLRIRFKPAHLAAMCLGPRDEDRVAFYVLAQRISLIEGPLRIAATDYPDRDWMLALADYQLGRVLAELSMRA